MILDVLCDSHLLSLSKHGARNPTCSGQVLGRGGVGKKKLKSTLREVGHFKGIVRVVMSDKAEPLFDLQQVPPRILSWL